MRFLFLLAILLPVSIVAAGQNETKRGGLCFRVDDNPPLLKLHQYDSVFSKYQQHFSMAMTSWVFPISPAYVDSLISMSLRGHEVMDNTPTHQTQFFNLLNASDTALFVNDPGVDHVTSQRVCLKIAGIDTTQSHNEGLVNTYSNLIISQLPGEFSDLTGNPYYFALYFNAPVNRLCTWYDLKAVNPFDVDSVYVKSLWDEPVLLGNHWGVSYHKMTQRNVIMSQAAIKLLGQRSLDIYESIGMERPTSWIHPAGAMPWISAYDMKWNLGDGLGYNQGSNYINYSYLCYNEYNPSGIAQFGMQPSDNSLEYSSLSSYKHLVANAIAKHYVKVDVSYFSSPSGGWSTFLNKTDSLLSWCVENDIPVRTYQGWKSLLYDSLPNRVINIFPMLQTDLDEDDYPDGYDLNPTVVGIYDTTDGVPESDGRSFALTGSGNIFQINALAGVETGKNIFSVWTRGGDTSSTVTFEFFFPERNITRYFAVPADTSIWTNYTTMIDVPDSVTIMNLQAYHYDTVTDTVRVSGMNFRSSAFLKKSKLPEQEKTANLPFENVNLNNLVIDTLYAPSTITWTASGQSTMNFQIMEGNILKILRPQSFWTGKDSVYLVAQSPDGLKDSCFMAFNSLAIPFGCSGMPITLFLLDTLENDIIQWTSVPFDSTISNPNIYNPTVSPKVPTKYTVLVINPLGPINRDSVFIMRYPFPEATLTGDTAICEGDSIDIIATGGAFYLWNTGDTTAVIRVSPDTTTNYKVTISSEYECSVSDSMQLLVVQKPTVILNGLLPAYCVNDWAATIYGTPSGGEYGATSGLVEQQFFPSLADTGINKVWYAYADSTGCGDTDTVTVRVIPLPYIIPLPDTNLCVSNSIILHAGPGSDNYLWSDGSRDSIVVVDSTGHGVGLYPIWVYVTKDGCVEKDTALITFIICPGIGENRLASKVKLFPNPAVDEVMVTLDLDMREPFELSVSDPAGKTLFFHPLEKRNRVNLSGLTPGIYLLTISGGGESCTFRLVKNR